MQAPLARRGSAAVPLAVATLLALGFVGVRLASVGWDETRFLKADSAYVVAEDLPPGIALEPPGEGFDGLGFYRLALDPITRERVAFGIVLDIPALRHQRILYPAIAWALAGGGEPAAVPWLLIAINVVAVALLGLVGGLVARSLGRHPAWGLVFPLYPGLALSLGLDLSEATSSVLLLSGLLAIRRRRFGAAAAALTAAVLARETTLLVALGIAVAWAVARRRREQPAVPLWVAAVPLAADAAWQSVLWSWWGRPPLADGGAVDLGPPLYGLARELPGWFGRDVPLGIYQTILLVAIAVFVVLVVRALPATRAFAHERYACLIGLGLSVLLARTIWYHHWGFLRAVTELYLLGAMILLGREGQRLDRVAVAVGTLWASVLAHMLANP